MPTLLLVLTVSCPFGIVSFFFTKCSFTFTGVLVKWWLIRCVGPSIKLLKYLAIYEIVVEFPPTNYEKQNPDHFLLGIVRF